MLYAISASLIALGATFVAARYARALARCERPEVDRVLARIDGELGPGAPVAARQFELDELVLDVDRRTQGARELSTSLVRIAMASGTALAIATLAAHPDFAHVPEASAAFAAGVVGAMLCAYFGRLASARARALRAEWSELSRKLHRRFQERSGSAEAPQRPAG